MQMGGLRRRSASLSAPSTDLRLTTYDLRLTTDDFSRTMIELSSATADLVASQSFWFIATLDVVASIGIEIWVRMTRTRSIGTDRLISLATGQRKDTWLVCAIVWIVVLGDGFPLPWLLHAAGTVAMSWLLRRAVQRILYFARRT